MDWIRATYGFRLVAEDLSPNLGCFWYFFTEMFDNFRVFSSLVRLLPGGAVRAGRRQARVGRTDVLRVHRQAAVRRVLALSNPRRRVGIPRVAPALSNAAGGRGWIRVPRRRRVRRERVAVAHHVAAVDRRQGGERQLLLRDDAGVDGDAERAVRFVRRTSRRKLVWLKKKSPSERLSDVGNINRRYLHVVAM